MADTQPSQASSDVVGDKMDDKEDKTLVEVAQASQPEPKSPHVSGMRNYLMTASFLLMHLTVNIEVTIVGTSLQTIANDLQDFRSSGWIVTGYLTSFTAFVVIWAKLSDIIGRRAVLVTLQFIFAVFSGASGAAQSMNQLITFRVLQGIGAGGTIAVSTLIIFQMVPPQKLPLYGGLVSLTNAIAYLTGPLIGGGLSENTTWRWVFLINIPLNVVATATFFFASPPGFPHQHESNRTPFLKRFNKASLARVDAIGAFLLLSASFLLITVLLEGGIRFGWSNAASIVMLIVSVLVGVAFVLWERRITKIDGKREPVLPWRLLRKRFSLATYMTSILCAVPINLLVISLPQRYQTIHGLSPFQAGVRLIPFNSMVAVGGVLINTVAAKTKIAPIYLLWFGTLVQLSGLIPLSLLSADRSIPPEIYAFQILIGFGSGAVFNIAVLMPPRVAEKRDLSTATGAFFQFRILGGALGAGIGTSILNSRLRSQLDHIIPSVDLDGLLESPGRALPGFSRAVQQRVIEVFAESYRLQAYALIGFTCLQFVVIAMFWRRPHVMVAGPRQEL